MVAAAGNGGVLNDEANLQNSDIDPCFLFLQERMQEMKEKLIRGCNRLMVDS